MKFVEEEEGDEEEEEISDAELKDVHLNFEGLPSSDQFSQGEEEEEEELMEDEDQGGVLKSFPDEQHFGDPGSSLGEALLTTHNLYFIVK